MASPEPETPARPPFLVAITGGSGSGKSTLAEALVTAFGPARALHLGEDNYYWPLSRYGQPRDPAEWKALTATINFDAPDSKDTAQMARDLAALKGGRRVRQPVYDYARHDRDPDQTLELVPHELLVLEGIHVLSIPEIAPLIDLSVYVETQDDLRLARRIRRDVVERGRDIEGVLAQYLATVRPAHYRWTYPAKFQAHLVIADEGLPAYGDVRPGPAAVARMLAPVLERLATEGYVPG